MIPFKLTLTLTSLLFLLIHKSTSYIPQFLDIKQCPTTLLMAVADAYSLQTNFWNSSVYESGEIWTDANAFEDLNNLMLALKVRSWDIVNTQSQVSQLGAANAGNWDSYFEGSYDDAQWVLLLYYKISDYLRSHGEDDSSFMGSAGAIYDYVSAQWDDRCGGGLWWSSDRTYKNAITNELYLLTSANGYVRTGNQTYLENAKKTADWLFASGMRNSDGLWNDGLDNVTCQNNGQTTWTYNQGVIASGLGYLGVALNDSYYFDQAEITLDAAITNLTVDGVLKESCDDPEPNSNIPSHSQQIFKGVFTKHLQYYLDAANDPVRTAKYKDFFGTQQKAINHNAKNSLGEIGNVWYAPDQGGSLYTAETCASGLAATIAAAKYGPCSLEEDLITI